MFLQECIYTICDRSGKEIAQGGDLDLLIYNLAENAAMTGDVPAEFGSISIIDKQEYEFHMSVDDVVELSEECLSQALYEVNKRRLEEEHQRIESSIVRAL